MRNGIFAGFVLAIWCIFPAVTNAQNFASVTGTVTDTSGAAVADASVTLLNTGTNASYAAKTGENGAYRIADIPPGPGYALTVRKDGFEIFVVNNLYLPVATATTQDVQLKLGTIQQRVEVTAEGSITLNTTDTSIGNTFDMRTIESLPNEFRDDPGQLLRLEAGVVSAQTPRGNPSNDPNFSRDGSVAGARADQDNIIVDGIDATDFAFGASFQTQAAIPVEAIQEFNTLVANPTPAYGGRSGAQTIITTKSGSNTWHGSAYEFNRTAATEANTYFNNQIGVPRLGLERNQFGANLGGAAVKDKLFFFFEYDGRRDNSAQAVDQLVPFPHVQNGELAYINNNAGCTNTSRLTSADVSTNCATILSAAQVAALDPCNLPPGCTNDTTPGFTALGVAPSLLSLFKTRYPAPNDYSGGDGINTAGFRFNAPDDLTENGYVTRLDYNINTNNKLFARFNFRNETSVLVPNQFPGDPLTAPNIIQDRAWVIGETWTASPNFINQFTYGETRANDNQPILFNPAGGVYELSFFGGALANPYVRQSQIGHIAPDPTFRDDITYLHGKHSITFGAQWNPIKLFNSLTNDLAFIQLGLGGAVSSLPSNLEPGNILQDPVAQSNWDNFFVGALGAINNLQALVNFSKAGDQLPQGTEIHRTWRINELAGYVQDSWKARNDLTITFGVRYQFQTVPYETNGVQSSFLNTNLNSILATRESNGLNGISGPGATPELIYQLTGKANHAPPLYPNEAHDFSPRLGFAWNPSFSDGVLNRVLGNRNTVFRAGAALIYDETVVNALTNLEDQSNYIFGNSVAAQFGGGGAVASLQSDPRFTAVNSLPFPITPPPFQIPTTPTAIFNYGIDNQFHTPYSITASFGLQRELPGGFQLELDYYGRFGRKLLVLADGAQTINFVDPASKQSLAQAFTVLELAAQKNLPTVPDQPFFENQMNAALGGPGFCEADFGSSCTAFVYDNNGPALALGSTGGVASGIPLPQNVGLTPQFFINALATNKGSSSYNALFTTLRKKLSHNLQFDFNYTYSHSIDNNSIVANENGNFEAGVTSILCDATNTHVCRGNSEFDATNQISADFVYDLPVGRGQTFGRNVGRLVNQAIGGWQISGIETWRTGLAQTAGTGIASTTSLAADAGEVFVGPRSALASGVHVDSANNNQVQFYKNPQAASAAFIPVTGLEVGTRDNLRGPHFSNLDLGVAKNFPLTERYRLQFRADAYNVFNHTNFGLPNSLLTSGSFGVISGLAGQEPSRVMQFALRFDF
jgi:hypothetical protein